MLTRKIWFLISFMFAFAANAESPWPSVQSNMYPYANGMLLTRHEQTILLGEGDQQTGIFFSALRNTFSEQVQNELINDALLKSWSLHSLVRLGKPPVLIKAVDINDSTKNQIIPVKENVTNEKSIDLNAPTAIGNLPTESSIIQIKEINLEEKSLPNIELPQKNPSTKKD